MLHNTTTAAAVHLSPSSDHFPSALDNGVTTTTTKKKRKPAGTPDPDAEVIALSPRTLLESDRYICEICNQGFQREQNLQMHRRRHKVPWKLLKRSETRQEQVKNKRVYVCPEPSCLHHNSNHALGDLVGIKKHFRRKHSNHKQWICDKCSKAYAVQSDFKAHLKTCGTRGHSCDCGRVFSRVESFIEHQDDCTFRSTQCDHQLQASACSTRTASTTTDADFNINCPLSSLAKPKPLANNHHQQQKHNLELQLSTSSSQNHDLKLSIGSSSSEDHEQAKFEASRDQIGRDIALEAAKMKEFAENEFEKAQVLREEAKKQLQMAELEFVNAKMIRQQAQSQLEKAQVLREEATKKLSSTIMQITCHSCKVQFRAPMAGNAPADDNSLAMSMSICLQQQQKEKESDMAQDDHNHMVMS